MRYTNRRLTLPFTQIEESVPRIFRHSLKLKIADETGNAYITGILADRIEIPAANLGVQDHGEFKNSVGQHLQGDRQPEIARWPPKPEILISPELSWQIARDWSRIWVWRGASRAPNAHGRREYYRGRVWGGANCNRYFLRNRRSCELQIGQEHLQGPFEQKPIRKFGTRDCREEKSASMKRCDMPIYVVLKTRNPLLYAGTQFRCVVCWCMEIRNTIWPKRSGVLSFIVNE